MAGAPFYWTAKEGWYLWIRGVGGKRKRIFLAKTKKEAFAKWKASTASSYGSDATFQAVAKRWLTLQRDRYRRGEVSKTWVDRVARQVATVLTKSSRIMCSEVTHEFVLSTLPENASSDYVRTRLGDLKQLLAWAVAEKHINESTLANVKMPAANRRDLVLTIDDHRDLVNACSVPSMRCMLWFAWNTGARPSELRELCWEHLVDDCSRAILTKHKTAKATKRARVVFFPPNMQNILLAHKKTKGHVFLNSHGKPWTKDALVTWIRRLRERTGRDGTAYAYRHSFITRAMEQGVAIADVAELTGTSVQMIARNYGHLDKSRDRLQAIASSVRVS
ncbi:MAG TPA: hypothetical protein DDW52_27730 [Planctomycetaceae bacterium]|nr:hypothetical protein [Planctomycetaceae bacterium]